jgi:hypothetical protein
MPEPKAIPDTNLKDACAGACLAEEFAADKDARIAQLTRDLARTKREAKEIAARLFCQRSFT